MAVLKMLGYSLQLVKLLLVKAYLSEGQTGLIVQWQGRVFSPLVRIGRIGSGSDNKRAALDLLLSLTVLATGDNHENHETITDPIILLMGHTLGIRYPVLLPQWYPSHPHKPPSL